MLNLEEEPTTQEERKRFLFQGERNSLEFARRLREAGLIANKGDFLNDWRELHVIYKKNKRELPESLSEKLRFAVFLKARKLVGRYNDASLLNLYKKLGEEVDSYWFQNNSRLGQEEDFIVKAVENGLVHKQDGVGWLGHQIDWDPDGHTIVLTAEELKKRAEIRQMVANREKSGGYTQGSKPDYRPHVVLDPRVRRVLAVFSRESVI